MTVRVRGDGRELVYPDASRYRGEFADNKKHGTGTQEYADGSVYEGCFVENRKHGVGKLTKSCGDRYEGCWQGNLMHGQGTFWHRRSGWKYVGEW